MILRTTLPAAPNSYKTYLLKTLLKYDLFCQLGPSTSLREFVFMCTCVCVCVCVCFFIVMERMVANGKNIKNLKCSKLNSAGFCINCAFFRR